MYRERLERGEHIDLTEIPDLIEEFKQALLEKDREIAKLKEWQSIVLFTGTDQEAVIRMAATEYTQVAVQAWKDAYHTLMGQAVRFAEKLGIEVVSGGLSYIEYPENVQDFLASPEVRTWRGKEGKP